MEKKKSALKFQNYVQRDGVIKEQVSLDRKVQNSVQWAEFDINKICLKVAKTEGFSEEEYKKLVQGCAGTKKTPFVDDWKLPACREYPRTTAGEVGWRHEKRHHNLELYGQLYRSPKLTMAPLYEPAEVIFLG